MIAQMARAVEDAHRAGHKVMAHAEGTVGIKAAVRAGVDSIEHGTMLDDEGAKSDGRPRHLAGAHTLLLPARPADRAPPKAASPAAWRKALPSSRNRVRPFRGRSNNHVKIAYGVDDDDIDESVSKEFGALVRGGMTPLEAMQAATIHGAELLLSLDKDLGAIEPGKYADLVAVAFNPPRRHQVMEKVKFVMKGGEVWKSAE